MRKSGSACDPLWYKDAIIYTSPLRDDGYDIAHYERVDSRYGATADFQVFLDAAHPLGMQVITELVINHTSDAHPWFQAARRAPAGSHKRDFYVWSDTVERYRGANPDVRRAVLKVMRFWLDKGVDGLRLDAVAHLFEREGTSCENLPETHQFLKQIRAEMDERYTHRVLLAEANHPPADVRPYFGDGDECHLAFHFPLMPRLFMALNQEGASSIVDTIKQTESLPEPCQWALFLRNHDELTLSAVSDDERDCLLSAYAPDPRMRLNHGICRRLAPLLGNDRGRLELAYALLLSLPRSPVLYYGDEIGMGDDRELGDRNGVRTPMPWSDDAHAGFTVARAHPVAPIVDQPLFGHRVLNVASQERSPDSLLARVTALIHARRHHRAFGRGTIEFVPCDNPRVLAFLRRYEGETILVTANLADSVQPVTLELPVSTVGEIA